MIDREPTAAPDPPALLTAQDVARTLQISVRTLRTLDALGKLPLPVRVGRAVRWPRKELDAWIAAGCPDREAWQVRRADVLPIVPRGRNP